MLSPSLSSVVLFLTFVVTLVPLSYWVYSDAIARGSSFPSFWSVAGVLCWPVGLYYLIRYRHSHERQRPPTRRNRIAKMLVLCSVASMIAGPFLAPPEPFAQVSYRLGIFVATLPVAYLLVYWCHPERTSDVA
jgi:hypothetical protein